MVKYAYPAVFTPESDGGFSIHFPDLESCYTCGDDMIEGLTMAEDVLALVLYEYDKDGRKIPLPSKETNIALSNDEFINFVACDTLAYRKMYNNNSVMGLANTTVF